MNQNIGSIQNSSCDDYSISALPEKADTAVVVPRKTASSKKQASSLGFNNDTNSTGSSREEIISDQQKLAQRYFGSDLHFALNLLSPIAIDQLIKRPQS